MIQIERIPNNARMSAAVIANGIVYLKGVTPRADAGTTIQSQTSDVLAQIEQLLTKANSGVDRLMTVNIWLTDIQDMAGLNEVYDAWIRPGQEPVRACVQAALAQPHYRVEVQVTAAQR